MNYKEERVKNLIERIRDTQGQGGDPREIRLPLAELGRSGLDTVPLLLGCLNDPYWAVRFSVVYALGEVASRNPKYEWSKAIPALIECLRDEDASVRGVVPDALGRIAGDHPKYDLKDAVAGLVAALNDDDGYTRARAAEALQEHFGIERIEKLEGRVLCLLTYGSNLKAVAGMGEIAIPALVQCLSHKDRNVRWGALEILAWKAKEGEINVDLKPVREALLESVDSARKEGDQDKLRDAERKAARRYILIANAVARFRATLDRMEGMQLEGTFKPPRGTKMYRQGQARAMA